MTDNFCVYLDAGHGGLSPRGEYETAPSKMFKHSRGVFHGDGFFYEGVWNRVMVNRVAHKLTRLGISNIIISHEYLDLSLDYRVDTVNWYYRNYNKGVIISTHANASGVGARGYEIYTSPGRTQADMLAEFTWNQTQRLLGDRIQFRSDTSDGDHDKEVSFYILRKTVMPAILIEHLFFDNFDDAMLLMNEEIIELFAEAQVRAVIDFMNAVTVG